MQADHADPFIACKLTSDVYRALKVVLGASLHCNALPDFEALHSMHSTLLSKMVVNCSVHSTPVQWV